LVHVDDLAELYTLALDAPTGARYLAVGDESPTVLEAVKSLSRAAGCPDQIESITLEEARTVMGPIADAFALDQQLTSAHARKQLGWAPPSRDVLAELTEA
jgi:nucleoside-diphosphate-sugar epimerase